MSSAVDRFCCFPARELLALCAALACAPADQGGGLSVVDGLGRTVSIRQPARRIVSLAPATTELLFALGAGPRVVGRTRWCDFPAEALSVKSVGDGLNPNVEAVAATAPDLVVMYATAANATAIEQLTRLGIAVVNLPMDQLADVSRSARMVGPLLGDSARADSAAAAFDSALARVRAARPPGGPTVAMIAWDNPPIVIGSGSFLTELVHLAGGRNVFSDITTPSATVSIETIASRDPDLLLLSDTSAAWARRPEWRVVRAAREQRLGHMNGTEFDRPSFRAPEAVRKLAGILGSVAR